MREYQFTMKKATVSSTSPGAGQLFSSVPRSFNNFGSILVALIAGLTDNVSAVFEYDSALQTLAVNLTDSVTGGDAESGSLESTPTASTRTAYDWGSNGVPTTPANIITDPTEPLSVSALVDYLFRNGASVVVIDQIGGMVHYSKVASGVSVGAFTHVATFTTTSGNTWE